MLVMDIADMDEMELEQTIFDRCSKIGLVTDITIRRDDDPYRRDFAIVEMSTEKEATEIVEKFGGKVDGFSVVMEIYHDGKLIRGPQTLH